MPTPSRSADTLGRERAAAVIGAASVDVRSPASGALMDGPLTGRSTRTYLYALSLSILLPMLLVAGYLGWRFGTSERERFEQQTIDLARNVGIAVERELSGMTTALQVLATGESLERRDLQTFHRRVVAVAKLQGAVIVLRDAQSRLLLHSSFAWGEPLPDRSSLAETDAVAARLGQVTVSDFFRGASNGQPSIAAVVPLSIDGVVTGFLSASFDVERFRKVLVEEAASPWIATLIDRKGVTIANTAYPERAGQPAAAPFLSAIKETPTGLWRGLDSGGKAVGSAYRTLDGGWVVAVGAFEGAWRGPLGQTLLWIAGGSFLLIAAAIGGSIFLAQRISGPLASLTGMGAALGRGEPIRLKLFDNRETNAVARTLAAASIGLRERDAELRASSIRYRNALRVGRIGAWETNLVSGVRLWTDEGMALFGLDLPGGRGVVGGPLDEWRNAFHPDDRGIAEAIHASLATQDGIHTEYRIRRPDGETIWLLGHGEVAERDADGRVLRLTNVAADITESKRAQEALKASEERFRAIQETSIDGFMIMESIRSAAGAIIDFRWVYANEAAERIVGKARSWFIGRRLLEEMPGNRDEGLFDAYARVVETGEPWTSEFTYRHEGLDIYIRAVAAKAGDGFAISFADLSERRRAEERVRDSEARLAAALKAGKLGVYHYDAREDRLTWDAMLYDLAGVPPNHPVSLDFFQSQIHPDDRPAVARAVAETLGQGLRFAIEYRISRLSDGAMRWLTAEGETTFENGVAVRHIGMVRDITAQKEGEAERRLLLDEMNHRVKNLLATVRAIAMQTLKGDGVDPSARRAFDGRLMALASAHDLLMQEGWSSARLRDAVERTLEPHRGAGSQVLVEGDDAAISPKLALAVSLSLHELATNAMKYGALSIPEGRVALRWTTSAGRLHLTWRETGGPRVSSPERKGFGSTLIERLLGADVDGRVRMEFLPTGVVCTIDAALDAGESETRS